MKCLEENNIFKKLQNQQTYNIMLKSNEKKNENISARRGSKIKQIAIVMLSKGQIQCVKNKKVKGHWTKNNIVKSLIR